MGIDRRSVYGLKHAPPGVLVGSLEDLARAFMGSGEALAAEVTKALKNVPYATVYSPGSFTLRKLAVTAVLLEEIFNMPDLNTVRINLASVRDACDALGISYEEAVMCMRQLEGIQRVLLTDAVEH